MQGTVIIKEVKQIMYAVVSVEVCVRGFMVSLLRKHSFLNIHCIVRFHNMPIVGHQSLFACSAAS